MTNDLPEQEIQEEILQQEQPTIMGLTHDQFTTAEANLMVINKELFTKKKDFTRVGAYEKLAEQILFRHFVSAHWYAVFDRNKLNIFHRAMDLDKNIAKFVIKLDKVKDYYEFYDKVVAQARRLITEHQIQPDEVHETTERVNKNRMLDTFSKPVEATNEQ